MADTNIHQSSLLASIVADRAAALDKQKKVSSEATCSMLRESRRMLGILNKADEIELTVEFINAMRFIADHDYLYYLSLIGRFDLIREIFSDKDTFAAQLMLVEEMEKEQANQKNQQELLIEQSRLASKLKVNDIPSIEHKILMEQTKMLANMDVYHYLHLEQQRIYTSYYDKQTAVFTKSFEGRVSRIKEAIALASDMPNVSNEDKLSLSTMLDTYEKDFNKVKAIPTINARGELDFKAVDKKMNDWKGIDDKYSKLLIAFLETHSEKKGFLELLKTEITATQVFSDEIYANEIEKEQELDELTPHLESARFTVKADLEHHMNETLEILKHCKVEHIQEQDKLAFKLSLHKLREHVVALSRTNDDREIHDISTKFASEIAKIKPLVDVPVVTKTELEQFNKAMGLFIKIEGVFNSDSMISARNRTSVLPHPPADESLPSPPPYENSLKESSDILAEKFQICREDMRFFRAEQHKVNPNSPAAGKDSLLIIQEEPLLLDDESKDQLKSALVDIIQKIDELKESSEVSPPITKLARDTQQLCKGLESQLNGEFLSSRIQLLKENLHSLSTHYAELEENLQNLNMITDCIEKIPRASL